MVSSGIEPLIPALLARCLNQLGQETKVFCFSLPLHTIKRATDHPEIHRHHRLPLCHKNHFTVVRISDRQMIVPPPLSGYIKGKRSLDVPSKEILISLAFVSPLTNPLCNVKVLDLCGRECTNTKKIK